MKTLQERLALAFPLPRKRGLFAEIARLCGVSSPTVTAWFNKPEKVATLERANAEKLCQAYGLKYHPRWLAEGEGPMLVAATAHEESNVSEGPAIRGLVPLISWVRAGNWCEVSDPLQPGDAEEWLPCPAAHSQGTFALRVRGDSMTAPHGNSRTYPEGCIIFVDPERKNPVNGDRIVACLEGSHEVTFKIYKNEDGRQWLQPLNPSHEPIREAFHVLGTVIGKWEPE